MRLAIISILILATLLPNVLADYITGMRCQTYNAETTNRDIARGNRVTGYFVNDVLNLPSAVFVYKGVTCTSLYSPIDVKRFKELCTQRCVKGRPEFVCASTTSLCDQSI
ncbi:hypothetical protein EJ03DRAFT_106313 [Teratosphaeria nubilosa]|uniref:Uncharacterized protein n=1 Tax=Teratosphaeria nubilosa TaxID=161662 RepID=A0A6G1L827_9PEZI|nr:hypothetical protein EJ03DRAFT_106313 [Teratosphaeria nubilosa]